jgi:glycosyltransferase involved in cell wall biosynthesis
MKVSVAMCTYNGAQFLQQQLDSLVRQTLPPSELVICDDLSTDKTIEIVRQFSATAPFPVKFFQNKKNLGSTANFSRAISLCDGDLIALCDQDDVWHAEKIARQVQAFEQNPEIGGVFCDGELIDSASAPLNLSLWDSMDFTPARQQKVKNGNAGTVIIRRNFVTGATLMFKMKLRSQFLPIPPEWVHDGWIAWMILLHSRLHLLPNRLISYRIHANQQIGADLQSLSGRLKRDKNFIIDQHVLELTRLDSLEQKLNTNQAESAARYKNLVHRKRAFLKARIAMLRLNIVFRFASLTTWAMDYMRFANGFRSIVGDLLL